MDHCGKYGNEIIFNFVIKDSLLFGNIQAKTYLIMHKMTEKQPKTIMLQMTHASIHATSLLNDGALNGISDYKMCFIVGNTNIILYSSYLNQIML